MPRLNAANEMQTTLAQNVLTSDTTIYVNSAVGFPSAPFRISIDNEILEVSAVNGSLNTFTVSRGMEGTTATTHNIGVSVQNRWTAGTYQELVSNNAYSGGLVAYAVATGSANAYAVTLNPAPTAYTDGMAVAVKINVDNTGAATLNVSALGARAIKKPNGNDVAAGDLKQNSIYTLRYNGTNFILQGEGSDVLTGNAAVPDVLASKTFYNTDPKTKLTGTMTDQTGSGLVITPSTADQAIPQGYFPGNVAAGKVAGDANFIESNIKAGIHMWGKTGTFAGGEINQIIIGEVSIGNNSTSATVTIASVVTANSILISLGSGHTSSADNAYTTQSCFVELTLASSTTVTGTRMGNIGTISIPFIVIEFKAAAVKTSRQAGTIEFTISDQYEKTASITAINTSKYILTCTGKRLVNTYDVDSSTAQAFHIVSKTNCYLKLTTASTITARRSDRAISPEVIGSFYVGYNIIELN